MKELRFQIMNVLRKFGCIKNNTFPRERRSTFDDRVVEAILFGSFTHYLKPGTSAQEPCSDYSKNVAVPEPPEKREEILTQLNIPDNESGNNAAYLELLEVRRQRYRLQKEKELLLESDERLRFMVEGDKSLKAFTSVAIEDSSSSNAKKEDSQKGDGENKSSYVEEKTTYQESQQKWFNLEGFPDWPHQNEGWRSANRDELWNGGSSHPNWTQDGDHYNQPQQEYYFQDRSSQDYPIQDEYWCQASYSEWQPQQGESLDGGIGFGSYPLQDGPPYDSVWCLGRPPMYGRGSQRFQSQYKRGFSNSGQFPRPTFSQYNKRSSQSPEEDFKHPRKPKSPAKSKRGKGKRRNRGGSKKKVSFEDQRDHKDNADDEQQ